MTTNTNVSQSSDGESFKVEGPIANQSSQTIDDNSIKNLITKKSLPSTKNKLTMSKKTTALQSSNGEAFNVEEAITKTTTSNELTMPKKMIVLQSFDGHSFKVEEAIARQSKTISLMIEDDCNKNVITLENVTSKILAIVIEYCKKHHVDADSSSSSSEEDLKKWDAELMEIDQSTIFQLILASNYLNIKGLHDLTCQTVADMIHGKTPDQIRKHFKITNDFTREEEKQIYQENQWVFE